MYMKNKYEGKSIIDMLKGIGDFSSEGDPDGSMKAAAIEYAQDMVWISITGMQ